MSDFVSALTAAACAGREQYFKPRAQGCAQEGSESGAAWAWDGAAGMWVRAESVRGAVPGGGASPGKEGNRLLWEQKSAFLLGSGRTENFRQSARVQNDALADWFASECPAYRSDDDAVLGLALAAAADMSLSLLAPPSAAPA